MKGSPAGTGRELTLPRQFLMHLYEPPEVLGGKQQRNPSQTAPIFIGVQKSKVQKKGNPKSFVLHIIKDSLFKLERQEVE